MSVQNGAVLFTKLTNGLQVKHGAICETAFLFSFFFFSQALTSLLRLLTGECSDILSGLTYSNIVSLLNYFF